MILFILFMDLWVGDVGLLLVGMVVMDIAYYVIIYYKLRI